MKASGVIGPFDRCTWVTARPCGWGHGADLARDWEPCYNRVVRHALKPVCKRIPCPILRRITEFSRSMNKAVISGIGPDQPGIVAAIGQILYQHGCNIHDSTMTRLAQEFAVILIVDVPPAASLEQLQRDFASLEGSHGMTVVFKLLAQSGAVQAHVPRNPYMVSVAGHDQAGITYQVSQVLANLGVNITDLNAQVIPGETRPVYIMMVEVDVPAHVTENTVREALVSLESRLDVEIQLRPLENVAL